MVKPIKTAIITYDRDYRDQSTETILMHTYYDSEDDKICYKSNNSFETVTTLIQELFTDDIDNKTYVRVYNYWICLEYHGCDKHNVHTYIIHGTDYAMKRLQRINDYYNQEILVKSN